MVTPAPAKARSGLEILVEEVKEWADEGIVDCKIFLSSIATFSAKDDSYRKSLLSRIETLEAIKVIIAIKARRILGEDNT